MKKLLFNLLLCISIMQISQAQSLYDLFSQEGLKLSASFIDDVGFNNINSFQFCGMDTICDLPVLKFYPRFVGFESNAINYFTSIHVDGEKVYTISNCDKNILYDFSLEVGETISEGFYEDFQLDTIYNVNLLDGSTRKKFDFSKGNNVKISWIYGLGDVTKGFLPASNAANFFNCVRIGDQVLWESENPLFTCEESTCFQPIPFFNFSTEDNTITLDNQTPCQNEYSFLWNFGDGNFSTEVNPVHEYQNFGCYQISLQIEEDCFPFSVPHTLSANLCSNDAWEEQFELSINASNPRLAIISANEEILYYSKSMARTSDAGQTWTNIFLPVESNTFESIREITFYDDMRGILILDIPFNPTMDLTSIFTTQDAGLTWNPAFATSTDPLDLELGDDGLAWVHLSNKMLRSNDFGNSWTELPEIFTSSSGGDIHYVDESNLYRIGTRSDILYKSIDQGDSWKLIPLNSQFYNFVFFDNKTVYKHIRNDNKVEMSFDAGETWISKELPISISGLHFSSERYGWITSRENSIYYTSDAFETLSASHCTGIEINDVTAINDSIASGLIRFFPSNVFLPKITKVSFNINLLGDCLTSSTSEESNSSRKIYPNPTSSILNIQDAAGGGFTYNIYSIDGKLVLSGRNQSQIEVNELAPGTYFLSLDYEKGATRQLAKFVVLR